MALTVNSNISSLNAQRNLSASQTSLTTSMQRLSSGLRINSAKDDAAGLAISDRFTAQIRGNEQASRNANDGISLAQTAEGALSEIGNNLQRMRELAVQSSNATNSDSDRAAINNEVQALSAEIDRVAQNSSFNGTKLLDGSFTSKTFQVGANNEAADSIQITAISSARTSALGGVGVASATVAGGATTGALAAGNLTLNGIQVGASRTGGALGQSTASAYSIAEAINAVSGQSGVTATANSNTVTGGAASAPGAIAADTFSINGINVGAVAAGVSAAGQGANVAAAINLVSSQTGVTASADATSGALTLTAADGRDISIGLNGTAADVATATTNKATFLTQTGLATANVGTQGASGGTQTVASGAVTTGTVAGVTTTDAVYTFAIDGNTVLTNTILAGATGNTVTAAQLDTAFATFAGTTAGAGYSLTGTFAAGTAQITKADGTAVAITSGTTGGAGGTVTEPTFAGTGFIGTTTGTGTGVSAANHGKVTLNSTSAAGIVYGGSNATLAGFAASGTATATTGAAVSNIATMNVLTATNALKALDTIDGALANITNSRAALGAYQNRFASVVANQQTTVENLSASRGRIQDADFAKETANLSRAQVLQQAGTAMLSQANQSAQGVLSLLR